MKQPGFIVILLNINIANKISPIDPNATETHGSTFLKPDNFIIVATN
jgi:hypothetical protein